MNPKYIIIKGDHRRRIYYLKELIYYNENNEIVKEKSEIKEVLKTTAGNHEVFKNQLLKIIKNDYKEVNELEYNKEISNSNENNKSSGTKCYNLIY